MSRFAPPSLLACSAARTDTFQSDIVEHANSDDLQQEASNAFGFDRGKTPLGLAHCLPTATFESDKDSQAHDSIMSSGARTANFSDMSMFCDGGQEPTLGSIPAASSMVLRAAPLGTEPDNKQIVTCPRTVATSTFHDDSSPSTMSNSSPNGSRSFAALSGTSSAAHSLLVGSACQPEKMQESGILCQSDPYMSKHDTHVYGHDSAAVKDRNVQYSAVAEAPNEMPACSQDVRHGAVISRLDSDAGTHCGEADHALGELGSSSSVARSDLEALSHGDSECVVPVAMPPPTAQDGHFILGPTDIAASLEQSSQTGSARAMRMLKRGPTLPACTLSDAHGLGGAKHLRGDPARLLRSETTEVRESIGHMLSPPEQGLKVKVFGDGWGRGEGEYTGIITEADTLTFTLVRDSGPLAWEETHVLREHCAFLTA